jgi:hypothetical protein
MPRGIANNPAAETSVCNCDVDDVRRHLLKQIALQQVNERLGPHEGDILREQGVHQSHQLASGKDEGTFMLMLGNFVVLAPVVGFVIQVELAEPVGTQDEVVTQVAVTDFGQASVLRDRVATIAFLPSQAHILSQMFMLIETGDVDDRSAELATKPRAIRTLAAALSRTGTACVFEVPLGVGNSLAFEVT